MNESSTNEQIETLDTTTTAKTEDEKIDQVADDAAGKGIRLEHKREGARTPGGVSGVDGGIFSK